MEEIILKGKKLIELKKQYKDCLQLERENGLTGYGEGMLFVLKEVLG